MDYDINRPWLTLDKWQKDYITTDPNKDCFLLCGRQVGKTTAMSIKAVELCMKHYKKGEYILICSITEKQGYHMLAKCLAYAREKYNSQVKKGKDKPTMHKLLFKNGTGVLCYAAGETGVGLVTVKPPVSVAVSPRMITETSLAPVWALSSMVILALIRFGLSTVKLLVLIPLPKVTALAPMRLVPVMTVSSVSPCFPELGLTEVMVNRP